MKAQQPTKHTKANDIVTVQLAKHEHKMPEFPEDKSKGYVKKGEDNLYDQYLLRMFNRSAKHNAIVTGKAKYIKGKGFKNNSKANKLQTHNDLADPVILDLELFGECYLQYIPNTGGTGGEWFHVDSSKMRLSKDEARFFFSNDWSKASQSFETTGYREFPAYTAGTREISIYHYKEYRPNLSVYGMPEYFGALAYIEMDVEISNFHLNNIKNGFWGSFLINFLNGQPTEEDRKKIEKKMAQKFTGSDNAGRFILNFADGKDRAAQLSSLTPPQLDKLFLELNKQVRTEIFSGHKITSPGLFGIETESSFGNRVEIAEKYELFQNTYVAPKQKKICEIFKVLFGQEFEIVPTDPIGAFDGQKKWEVMTYEEKRQNQGLPKTENQGNPVLDALNTMSPLLATKVLESMSLTEIRALATLPPANYEDILPPSGVTTLSMKKTEANIEHFKKFGKPRSSFEVIKTRSIYFTSEKDILENEVFAFSKQMFKPTSSVKRTVLDLLSKDPKLSEKDLAKVGKIKVSEVREAIDALVEDGLLKIDGDDRIITGGGSDILEDEPAKTVNIEVLYSYEVRPGLGAPIIPTTRDFCRELIELDRLYSREEIEMISAEVGYNVWEMRGGYYRKPGTETILPFCRHVWKQNIVKRK